MESPTALPVQRRDSGATLATSPVSACSIASETTVRSSSSRHSACETCHELELLAEAVGVQKSDSTVGTFAELLKATSDAENTKPDLPLRTIQDSAYEKPAQALPKVLTINPERKPVPSTVAGLPNTHIALEQNIDHQLSIDTLSASEEYDGPKALLKAASIKFIKPAALSLSVKISRKPSKLSLKLSRKSSSSGQSSLSLATIPADSALSSPKNSYDSGSSASSGFSSKAVSPNASVINVNSRSPDSGSMAWDEELRRQEERHAAFGATIMEYLRLITGTSTYYVDRFTPSVARHPRHNRKWDCKNIWCTNCTGTCQICEAPCCTLHCTEMICSDTQSMPEEKRVAIKLMSAVSFWFAYGTDEPTFLKCHECGRSVCPDCCGKCPINMCQDVICRDCKEEPWAVCAWHDGQSLDEIELERICAPVKESRNAELSARLKRQVWTRTTARRLRSATA